LLRSSDSDELAVMIAAGIQSGRFKQMDPRVAALVIRGAAFPLLQDILQESAPADVEVQFAELVLRMLGVKPEEAREIAGMPEPDVSGLAH
jgi:hypothetical protein